MTTAPRPVVLTVLIREDWRGFEYDAWREDALLLPPVRRVRIVGVCSGSIRGWERHAERSELLTCVEGSVIVAAWHDDDPAGEMHVLNPRHTKVFYIPAGWWHGVQNIGPQVAVLVEMSSILPHSEQSDVEWRDPWEVNAQVWKPT